MGKWVKKPSLNKPTIHYCPCGDEGTIKLYGSMWTCQRCIDLDRFVTEMHVKKALEQKDINDENSEVEDQSLEG